MDGTTEKETVNPDEFFVPGTKPEMISVPHIIAVVASLDLAAFQEPSSVSTDKISFEVKVT